VNKSSELCLHNAKKTKKAHELNTIYCWQHFKLQCC